MLTNPVDGGFSPVHAGESPLGHSLIDLPVALAINANLGAGVVGFEDTDSGVAAGDQIKGRSILFPHKI